MKPTPPSHIHMTVIGWHDIDGNPRHVVVAGLDSAADIAADVVLDDLDDGSPPPLVKRYLIPLSDARKMVGKGLVSIDDLPF